MSAPLIQIARNGKTLGEYTLVDLGRAIRSKSVLPTDHYWRKGMKSWDKVYFIATEATVALGEAENPKAQPPVIVAEDGFAAYVRKYAFGNPAVSVCAIILLGVVLFAYMINRSAPEPDGERTAVAAKKPPVPTDPYDTNSSQETPLATSQVLHLAEHYVKQVLKAPSTAKFSKWVDNYHNKSYDDGITQYYVVQGWVDSQNSFGAMLRNNYTICYSVDLDGSKVCYLNLGGQVYGAMPVQANWKSK
ncbi:MAG: hypothetical protein ORN83_12425 [Chthoniobacteraceae bacterium]|nr:hypothetical protein [Chthoniobacteraceae bacterium]